MNHKKNKFEVIENKIKVGIELQNKIIHHTSNIIHINNVDMIAGLWK